MRIAHVITRGGVGGAQTHVVELTHAQTLAGDDVAIVAGSDGPAMARARHQGARVHIVPSLGRLRTTWVPRSPLGDIRETLTDLAPDVVHGHSSHGGLVARIAARRLGLPSVYTAHGWPFQRGARWTQRLTSYVGEFLGGHIGDAVICVSQSEADRALRAHVVDRERLWVVPNGISDVGAELRHTSTGDRVEMVMVARFAPPKLQAELIEVLSGLMDLDWKMRFVGDGPHLAQCAELGRLLGDRACFLGHRDDVASILAGSDISILWSAYEGLPMSMIEAMRAGVCCVGSDLPGVRTLLLEPTPVGRVAATPADLARELRTLVCDRSAIQALGALARSRFEQSYSATAMAAATRSVYEAVLAD